MQKRRRVLNLFAVVLVDAGIVGMLVGLLSIVKPLRFLRIRSRKMGAALVGVSVAVIITAMLVPVPLQRVTEVRTDLDRVAPEWQFNEFHAVTIRATPERVYQAIKEVPAADILFFRTLIRIRQFGRPLPESVQNAPTRGPMSPRPGPSPNPGNA